MAIWNMLFPEGRIEGYEREARANKKGLRRADLHLPFKA